MLYFSNSLCQSKEIVKSKYSSLTCTAFYLCCPASVTVCPIVEDIFIAMCRVCAITMDPWFTISLCMCITLDQFQNLFVAQHQYPSITFVYMQVTESNVQDRWVHCLGTGGPPSLFLGAQAPSLVRDSGCKLGMRISCTSNIYIPSVI